MTAKHQFPRIGKLPPRYRFFLNPYRDVRFVAACPGCGQKPRQRKLPLVIHVRDWGTTVINKTCRYCPTCDLIIAHEDELREQIDRMLADVQPEMIGKPLFAIGTLDRPAWKQGMNGAFTHDRMISALHDFLDYDNYQPDGAWQQSNSNPHHQLSKPTPKTDS